MPTEEESRERGDNLANRRDDKFTDQRGRELQRRRAAQRREDLLALPTTREEGGGSHIGALVTPCSRIRMSDKTKDERKAASPR